MIESSRSISLLAAKRTWMMIEKCTLCIQIIDIFYFLKSQKISVNLGCFYVVLMILFLSACLLSSLDAFFFLQKQVISSLDMSSSLSTRVIYVVLRNDDLLSCCIRLRAAVSHEKCVTYCFYLHSLPIATLALILLWQY